MIDFQYPGKYILNEESLSVLMMDEQWKQLRNRMKESLNISKMQETEKLWNNRLLIAFDDEYRSRFLFFDFCHETVDVSLIVRSIKKAALNTLQSANIVCYIFLLA